MKRKITFLVVAVLCLQTLLAQNKTIRGTIVDSFSEPIIGASAHVKGTYTILVLSRTLMVTILWKTFPKMLLLPSLI